MVSSLRNRNLDVPGASDGVNAATDANVQKRHRVRKESVDAPASTVLPKDEKHANESDDEAPDEEVTEHARVRTEEAKSAEDAAVAAQELQRRLKTQAKQAAAAARREVKEDQLRKKRKAEKPDKPGSSRMMSQAVLDRAAREAAESAARERRATEGAMLRMQKSTVGLSSNVRKVGGLEVVDETANTSQRVPSGVSKNKAMGFLSRVMYGRGSNRVSASDRMRKTLSQRRKSTKKLGISGGVRK